MTQERNQDLNKIQLDNSDDSLKQKVLDIVNSDIDEAKKNTLIGILSLGQTDKAYKELVNGINTLSEQNKFLSLQNESLKDDLIQLQENLKDTLQELEAIKQKEILADEIRIRRKNRKRLAKRIRTISNRYVLF